MSWDDHTEATTLASSAHPDAHKRLLDIRQAAYQRGDHNLVGEVDAYLARLGVDIPEPPKPEASPEAETATPPKAERASKRK